MAVGVFEIDAAAAITGVDLTAPLLCRIGPVSKLPPSDPGKDLVELGFADEGGVVLGRDLASAIHIVERHFVYRLYTHEGPIRHRGGEAEDLGQERGGRAL